MCIPSTNPLASTAQQVVGVISKDLLKGLAAACTTLPPGSFATIHFQPSIPQCAAGNMLFTSCTAIARQFITSFICNVSNPGAVISSAPLPSSVPQSSNCMINAAGANVSSIMSTMMSSVMNDPQVTQVMSVCQSFSAPRPVAPAPPPASGAAPTGNSTCCNGAFGAAPSANPVTCPTYLTGTVGAAIGAMMGNNGAKSAGPALCSATCQVAHLQARVSDTSFRAHCICSGIVLSYNPSRSLRIEPLAEPHLCL